MKFRTTNNDPRIAVDYPVGRRGDFGFTPGDINVVGVSVINANAFP